MTQFNDGAMSLYIGLVIILFSGIGGGLVNALIRRETCENPETQPKMIDSMVFGIGAAALIPLFLEIAHSDLLNKMHSDWYFGEGEKKNYLLFFSYCFLAAISGPKFIKKLGKNVFKNKLVKRLEHTIKIGEEVIKQKEDKEKRESEENLLLAKNEEANELRWFEKHPESGIDYKKLQQSFNTKIGDINPIDRQKGRFGGQQENNGRRLSATIKESDIKGLYLVTATVEKIDPDSKDLSGYVIFYLHDSFRPCARSEQVKNGKAILPKLKSIGAYTIGAIADNGDTFLEYDLSQSPEATEEFKSI